MYSDYEYYKSRGGTLSETEYTTAAEKAADKINYYTFGRAPTAPPEMSEGLKRCECCLADILHNAQSVPQGIVAESNDGVSITYSQTSRQDAERQLQGVCRQHLCFPVNLMYAGSDGIC